MYTFFTINDNTEIFYLCFRYFILYLILLPVQYILISLLQGRTQIKVKIVKLSVDLPKKTLWKVSYCKCFMLTRQNVISKYILRE